MTQIHKTAIVSAKAELGADVSIGAYSIVESGVVIGDGCEIKNHVVIRSGTRMGARNKIFQFASIGEECQDKKFAQEESRLSIGDDNIIRESCTLHRGTMSDGGNGLTTVGSRNFFMVNVHIAHDCVVGDDTVIANNCALGGHVKIGDKVILGGFTGVHQFCVVGSLSFAGVSAVILSNVPAFTRVVGMPGQLNGLNTTGLKRNGFSQATISQLKRAYRMVARRSKNKSLDDALRDVAPLCADSPEVAEFVATYQAKPKRGVVRAIAKSARVIFKDSD